MKKNLAEIIKSGILWILLLVIYSCSTNIINYDRAKIIRKQNAEYSVYLNDNKIDINNVYLDKNNIKNVEINRKKKSITINQQQKRKLVKLKNINFNKFIKDSAYRKENKNILVVINGVPLQDSMVEKTKLEMNSIKSIKYIPANEQETISCEPQNKDILIIITE